MKQKLQLSETNNTEFLNWFPLFFTKVDSEFLEAMLLFQKADDLEYELKKLKKKNKKLKNKNKWSKDSKNTPLNSTTQYNNELQHLQYKKDLITQKAIKILSCNIAAVNNQQFE